MSPPDQTHPRYLHEAVYYQDSAQLVDGMAPLLREALDQGDDVVLVCREPNNRALCEALDDDHRVSLLPRPEIYEKAITAVTYFRDFADERVASGSRGLCVLGEVDFDTNGRGLGEWHRYEALVNHVLSGFPLWAMCAYATQSLPEPVLAAAEATHPFLRRNGVRVSNSAFMDPVELMRAADSRSDLVPDVEPDGTVPEVGDFGEMHHELTALLERAGMPQDRREDVILVVHELVTNGLRHGQPPVSVRVWVSQGGLVCAVTDRGPGFDDPFAGYVRGGGERLPEGRFGLWLARQLCDELVTARTREGFTVQLAVRY